MKLVSSYGEMWARNKKNLGHGELQNGNRGIYVLYAGSFPMYIGKGNLHSRLHGACISKRRGKAWDHFSWYAVPNNDVRHNLEALLLRILPFYLRPLTRQRGKLGGAEKIKMADRKSEIFFAAKGLPKKQHGKKLRNK
ncbi:MAG: hypothetical protein WBD87_07090 [Candidatus Acidiferrales bacterium]